MTSTFSLRMAGAGLACAVMLGSACSKAPRQRTFAAPEDAVRALTAAVKDGNVDEVIAIFGPDGRALLDSSDQATARRNLDVFSAAVRERWRLEPIAGGGRVLVIGYEDWPFPVPLVDDNGQWRFDTAAGSEEVLARRIGRNELAAIFICRTYVVAQRLYAARPHDGQPAGRFAAKLRSDPGRQNGLYWVAARGERPSPLGDLVARAAQEGQPAGKGDASAPFHGYYFRILPSEGGYALVAWPAQYDVTGVMTFLVNQDGEVREKDLGPDTLRAAQAISTYSRDASWSTASAPSRP